MKHFSNVLLFKIVFPDPAKDTFITLDGKKVAVPQGKAKDQRQYSDSHFSNSEYLIYKESQCRIRYLLELHMPWRCWKQKVLLLVPKWLRSLLFLAPSPANVPLISWCITVLYLAVPYVFDAVKVSVRVCTSFLLHCSCSVDFWMFEGLSVAATFLSNHFVFHFVPCFGKAAIWHHIVWLEMLPFHLRLFSLFTAFTADILENVTFYAKTKWGF